MNQIAELLSPESILLDLDATTKAQIRARIKTLQAGAQG